MKRKSVLGAAVAAVLAVGSTFATAQGPGYGYGPGMIMGGYGGPMAALNLTDEQHDKLFALQEANRKKNGDTMSTMRSEMFKLQRMYNADSVDSKACSRPSSASSCASSARGG